MACHRPPDSIGVIWYRLFLWFMASCWFIAYVNMPALSNSLVYEYLRIENSEHHRVVKTYTFGTQN